ncbi:hypothetical protein JOL79_11685 [Microbispora sp. RL4-1S]|uniref:Helix-turn-helix domain-containing protein n=1 Tax=Microbispora oryzae TaxID=2806554 RepID=A0A940WFD7_9ACTN|nr:hypothetical protein [Microbispora oryzae]MBP2704476.1 hypothetical protein [Microbispora oryzae]
MALPTPMRTSAEVASLLGISARTVVENARSGKWPSHRPANAYVFTDEDITRIYELTRTATRAAQQPAEQPDQRAKPAPARRKRTRPADRVGPQEPRSNVRTLVAKPPKAWAR